MAKEKTLDFSFSGLKTAVLHYVEEVGLEEIRGNRPRLCDVAASFQAAVIDSLLNKTAMALRRERLDSLAVVGGVACNSGLRKALRSLWHSARIRPLAPSTQHSTRNTQHLALKHLWIPPPALCTDNAAMIAGVAYHLACAGRRDNDLALNADPGWILDKAC
jgi:N6-L-threonylcarbamoyladenine synthase